MKITIHSPEPTKLASSPDLQGAFERRLGEPVELFVAPCAKCPRDIVVIDGGALRSTNTPT